MSLIPVLKNEFLNKNIKLTKINKYNYNYIYLFIRSFLYLIDKIKIINYVNNNFSEYIITLKKNINNFEFFYLIKCLKTSLLFKYKYLNDITCSDNLLSNFESFANSDIIRFKLYYIFQNIITTSKLIIIREIGPLDQIISLIKLYNSSNWAEREIFDLYGVFFLNHLDLRRILTDYGFIGFPLCKDFPLTGYLELRYCEELKCVKYTKTKLMQEYRNFNFLSPWRQYDNI